MELADSALGVGELDSGELALGAGRLLEHLARGRDVGLSRREAASMVATIGSRCLIRLESSRNRFRSFSRSGSTRPSTTRSYSASSSL